MDREKIRKTFNQLIEEGSQGFTLDLQGNLYTPPKGYAVAWMTCDNLDAAMDKAGESQYIGYWINPLDKEEFIEVVDIFDSSFNAFVNALNRNQKAIYDFSRDDVIDLRGFYDEGK